MNPVFVFLVVIGTFLLWVLLSGLFRLVGGITLNIAKRTKDALENDEKGKVESFVDGFKSSFQNNNEENKG